MNIEQPPVPARNFGPPNDLDRLLYAFLRAEVPEPWPVLKAPAHPAPAPLPVKSRRWPRLNSRLALAATVALCLVGSLALTSLFPGDGRAPGKSLSGATGLPHISEKPSTDTTPDGRKVKVWEKGNLKEGLEIQVKLVDLPPED